MKHLFDKRDLWGNRFSLWVIVLMAFAAPLCGWSLGRFRLDNDVEKWLPDHDSELVALRWAHQQFPVEERILLTWDGSSINDPRMDKLVEQLSGKLDEHGVKRGGLPYVTTVIEPRQALDVMQRNGIEPQEAVRRLEGTILGAGPLRIRLTEASRSAMRKTKRELQTALHRQQGLDVVILDASPDLTSLISIPAPQVPGEAAGEPSHPAILSVDGRLAENQITEHDLQVSWKGMRIGDESTIAVSKWLTEYVPERGDGKPLVDSVFFAPGCPVALAIGVSDAGLADKSETLAAIRSACNLVGIPNESLHMAGNVVSATGLNEQIFKAIWDPSFPLVQLHRRSAVLTSLLISALLTYLLVRSIRLATMTVLIASFAMCCSLAIVPLIGGSMNMVLIVMPTLLFVLALSGCIHLINYWKHAACRDESKAIVEAVRTSWMPSFLASLATAIGFIALCTSKLIPVRDFGLYAAAGTMASLFIAMYGLPSLMQQWTGKPPKTDELDQAGWRMFGKMLTIRSGWQSLVFIAICIGCGIGLTKLGIETKVIRYFPSDARIAQDYWYIETNLAGAAPVETIIRFDQQSQKDSNFLERMEIVRAVQEKMRAHAQISGSESLVDFQPISERPPEDAGFVQRTKYNKRASLIQQRIRDGELPRARSFYTVSEQGHDLQELGDGKLNQPGDELWRITAQVNMMTDNDVKTILADLHQITQDVLKLHSGSQHLIAGTVPLFVKTQSAVRESLIGCLGLAFALILGVFVISLRSIAAGMLAMIPNVMPIAVVLGVTSWQGQRINIGSMITASIALGIAVQGTFHYLTCVRSAMKNGKTRQEAIIDALALCGPAIWQSSAVVAIGLLALTFAELPLIARFGGLMASMVGVAFLGNVVLMPQLLGGPLGWLFDPAKPKLEKSVLAEAPPAIVVDEPIAVISQDAPVPKPHIETTVKKRRSPPRRELDAG